VTHFCIHDIFQFGLQSPELNQLGCRRWHYRQKL